MALNKSIEFLLLIINYSFFTVIKYILKTQQVSVARICYFNAYLISSNITNVFRSDKGVFLPFQALHMVTDVFLCLPNVSCLCMSMDFHLLEFSDAT